MRCDFCWRHCEIGEGQVGFCGSRKNEDGKLVSIHYGELVSVALDPIEKKPLYHFLPGSMSLSIAERGCNYRCAFCQNYEISQEEYHAKGRKVDPAHIVRLANEQGAESISFTYSEPLTWQDYMLDVAVLAKENGIRTVMVSNGSFSKEAQQRIIPQIDAYNIDVKGDEAFYQKICKASLLPVLDGIEAIVQEGKHLEVTTMVIGGIHNREMVSALGKALVERGVQVWHLSRFFPMFHMADRKETSEDCLKMMVDEAGKSGIPYIYAGNSCQEDSTVCPSCHHVIIPSHHYGGGQMKQVQEHIKDGKCAFCQKEIYGVYEESYV